MTPKFVFSKFEFADISTGNITENDGKLILKEDCPFKVLSNNDGIFLYVPVLFDEDEQKVLREFGFSDYFQMLVKEAAEQGIPYMYINSLGCSVENAPEFDW